MRALQLTMTFAAALLSVSSQAEKKIRKADLPAVVQKTAENQSQGATVSGYSVDRENGKVEYEVQMISNGHSKDITIAPDGRLVEIEEQVKLEDLAPEVRSGLSARVGTGKITQVESLTKRGTIVAYEAQVMRGSKHQEVQVGPGGKSLAHEE